MPLYTANYVSLQLGAVVQNDDAKHTINTQM